MDFTQIAATSSVAAPPPPPTGEFVVCFFPLQFFSSFFSVDPLFSNDEQKIDVEWMRKVFPDEEDYPDEDLKQWVSLLRKNFIRKVRDLKEQSETALKSPPISLTAAIATKLFNLCHPKT